MSQGWKPTLRGSAVDKCGCLSASLSLLAKGVRVSMDGKGRWIDNVFVERLWRWAAR